MDPNIYETLNDAYFVCPEMDGDHGVPLPRVETSMTPCKNMASIPLENMFLFTFCHDGIYRATSLHWLEVCIFFFCQSETLNDTYLFGQKWMGDHGVHSSLCRAETSMMLCKNMHQFLEKIRNSLVAQENTVLSSQWFLTVWLVKHYTSHTSIGIEQKLIWHIDIESHNHHSFNQSCTFFLLTGASFSHLWPIASTALSPRTQWRS